MGSRKYLLRKTLHAIATLVFVLTFNFFLFRVMPSDPVQLYARSLHLTEEDKAELEHELGLDRPLPQQFVVYMRETITGNLGTSIKTGLPVSEMIVSRLWPTILLVGLSTILSTAFGLLIGIKGAWQRGSFFDTGSLFGSLVLYSMPEGWLGMILLIFFAGTLHWFPAGQYESSGAAFTGFAHFFDVLNHLFLPALTLTLGYIGEYAIIMRSSLLETMGEDFVQTARAKGLQEKLVRRRHAVPNAILPSLTLIFYSFGYVLGGAIIVETVFSWPGIGLLEYKSIAELDYPVIQGVFLLFSAAVIVFNLAADILYGYLDPRIREA